MKTESQAGRIVPWLVVAVLLVAACSQPTPTPTPSPPATPTPAALQVATPSPQLTKGPTSPPAAGPTPTQTSRATQTPTDAPTAEPGPIPDLLAHLPVAGADAVIHDLLLDSTSGRLYLTDTARQLHVLDSATLEMLATLPAEGDLTLDTENERLYASHRYGEGDLTVVDTASLAVVGTISPGGSVAVDSARDRIYVGNPVQAAMPEDAAGEGPVGVRVYNAATLSELGEVPQPGMPVYNPLRDELYIVAYTVHQADPETLQVTGDLLPEITAQPLAWCNGCLAATDAHIYPDRNLLVVEVTILSAGKGPGKLPPPRFFDATTHDAILDLADIPPVERGCGERSILAEPVAGRAYRDERYSRYVSYNNLLVHDLDGSLETWRDGLALGVTNPNTGQMYVPHGDDTLVLDLATLSPVGTLPPVCIHTLDAAEGRIYALSGRNLVVFSEQGGWPEPLPAGSAGPLPPGEIQSIQPSPDYARDRTLFLTAGGKLYRSTDGGGTWAQLRGGLPKGEPLTLDLAISPDFARDGTLFAAGFRGDFWGEGVYRSTDGGDSWEPAWNDLAHLRVYDVALSPDYAADGTLLAYSQYQRLTPWEGGLSVFRSTDRGVTWTQVMTQPEATSLPPPEEFLPADPQLTAIQFRSADYEQGVERTTDGGKTWEPVVVTRQPAFHVQALPTSPTFADDRTVYVLSDSDLFRSTDGGGTWERWLDDRLAGRDYENKLTVAATSPTLDGGRHQLFLGSAAGEFWALDPADLTWGPVQIAERWPTVLEGVWVGEIEASPGGGVWLGTWGEGLAHYSDGGIEARYTVTDGLPTQYLGAIAEVPDGAVELTAGGRLWAGGDLPPGVGSFDGRTWTHHPFPEEEAIGGVFDIEVGPEGVVWAGAQAPGLLRWTGQAWEIVADPQGLTGWRIYDIEIDDLGTLWCATARGLVFFSDEGWSGQGDGETPAIEFGPDGAAYLLTSSASVWRYAAGEWTELPPPQEGQFLSAAALHVAADSAVWIGTHDGAFRYDGQAWRKFTAQDGLPANDVAAISEDVGGWLWFGTANGAARVDPVALYLSSVAWPGLSTSAGPAPTPQAAPTPALCTLSPAPVFAGAYQEGGAASRLGCPTAGPVATRAAFQPFEQGLMFWRSDEGSIYILKADGTWVRYPDTWDDSQPLDDPALAPPEGLWQPVRGFGKVWREQLGGPRAAIGWALTQEQALEMWAQPFAGGQMLVGAGGEVYVLYADGTWEGPGQP